MVPNVSSVFADMRQTSTHAGDQPIDVDLTHFALKRVLVFLYARVGNGLNPGATFWFGGIPRSDFRDTYEFAAKYDVKVLRTGLDAIAQNHLNAIKGTTDHYRNYSGPFRMPKPDIDKLIKNLTALPWSVVGTMRIMEVLDERLVVPCLRAAFGNDLGLVSQPDAPSEGFAEEFRKVFTSNN